MGAFTPLPWDMQRLKKMLKVGVLEYIYILRFRYPKIKIQEIVLGSLIHARSE